VCKVGNLAFSARGLELLEDELGCKVNGTPLPKAAIMAPSAEVR
jgi:hypothetical protein